MKKSFSKPTKVYLISLGVVLLVSFYPIYMGGIMLTAYLRDGGINAIDYPKYIIPYTPISIALILCVALLPVAFKYCKKYALPILSVLAVILFLGTEVTFEKVTVFSGTTELVYTESDDEAVSSGNDSALYYFRVVLTNKSGDTETRIVTLNKTETDQKVETWQWAMCAIPLPNMNEWSQKKIVEESITDGTIIDIQKISEEQATEKWLAEEQLTKQKLFKNALITEYSPVFKLHFYMISIIIILAVLGVTYGFHKMSLDHEYKKQKPLIIQLVSVIIFVGLCIFACFTAFFRTGEIVISPISAFLMTVFFLVFGITAGIYTGTWLYGKRKLFSMIIPAFIATATTIAMYIGEMVMMNWNLYRFGEGVIFNPIGTCPLAAVDILVIVSSGIITYFTLFFIRHKTPMVIMEM
jgi:hypothetical protein